MSPDDICVLCFKFKGDPTPWCKDNPGHGCTYGGYHEYPNQLPFKKQKQQQPSKE